MISKVIQNIVLSSDAREDFDSDRSRTNTSRRGMELAAAIVTFVVIILFISVIGRYLWNEVVAGASASSKGLITIAREATSIWQILGLYILSSLLFNH